MSIFFKVSIIGNTIDFTQQVDCVKIKWKASRGPVQPRPAIILVVQDHFAKFCWLRLIPECSASCVVLELIMIFRDFGCPSIIHTDNGREFRNALLEQLQVTPYLPTPYTPLSTGRVERANSSHRPG